MNTRDPFPYMWFYLGIRHGQGAVFMSVLLVFLQGYGAHEKHGMPSIAKRFLKDHLCLLQIRGAKPFSEPAIDLC